MARLLSIASAVLAFAGCTAFAQGVCPTQMQSFYDYFDVSYQGVQSDEYTYFQISLTDLDNQNDGLPGCSANPVYISQYADSDYDSCSYYADTRVGSPAVLPTGCLYQFTTNQGNTLVFNMSCYEGNSPGIYDAAITTEDGKNRTYFNGYGDAFCTQTSTVTETWTDGPTQTWTDGPTQTWTDGPTQTWTDGPTQTNGPTQTDAPAGNVTYSYVSFYTSTYYESYLVSYIRDFLNVTYYSNPPYYGIIDTTCGPCADGSGNYTCIAAFSNATQANESIYGGTHGYIYRVYNASWYNYSATNYTNVTFLYSYSSYPSYLVGDIRSFLNISSNFDCWGTLTAWCNTTRVNGNYTCNATFSNFTQAYLSYEGGNRGYIYGVHGAVMPGYSPNNSPNNNGGNNGDDSKSKAPVVIGVIIGIIVVVALVGVAVVVVRRRGRTPDEEGTQLNNVLDSRN